MAYRETLQKQIEDYIALQSGIISVSFFDLKEQKGFSVDGGRRVPSASTIKLVIMAELMRRIRAGELSLENKIEITEEMKTGGDGILKELEPGHHFTLKEIMTLMIIVSDNEATNILMEMLGMDSINRMASALELKEAGLGRKMMDSEAKKRGCDNFICADDIVSIFRKIYEGSCVDEEASRLMFDILPGHPYILAVLTSGMKSNKDGREAIGEISRMIYGELS